MAASGLDQARRDRNETSKDHLYALMDFCIEVLQTVDHFNEGRKPSRTSMNSPASMSPWIFLQALRLP